MLLAEGIKRNHVSLQVLVVNAQGDITRVSTRNGKDVVMKGTISQYFKLGQEGKYRVYVNQYTTNTVALNKHQHREASSIGFLVDFKKKKNF